MDRKVYIIHGSAIVQDGLAHILRKNFKCAVICHYNLESLKNSDYSLSSEAILFTEEGIANSDEYMQFIDNSPYIQSFNIVNSIEDKKQSDTQFSICLYNTPDEIYEQVKNSFKQQDIIEEVTEGLSNREIDVLKLVALGFANKEIADKLFVSIHTVMSHRKNITEKLGIKSISGLTVYAIISNYINTTNLNIKDLI